MADPMAVVPLAKTTLRRNREPLRSVLLYVLLDSALDSGFCRWRGLMGATSGVGCVETWIGVMNAVEMNLQ